MDMGSYQSISSNLSSNTGNASHDKFIQEGEFPQYSCGYTRKRQIRYDCKHDYGHIDLVLLQKQRTKKLMLVFI